MAPNEQLKRWIKAQGITRAAAARSFKYDRGNLHRILKGYARPSMDLAHRIEETTGGAVPMAVWAGFKPRKPAAASKAA